MICWVASSAVSVLANNLLFQHLNTLNVSLP
jgi:hypothetical protein